MISKLVNDFDQSKNPFCCIKYSRFWRFIQKTGSLLPWKAMEIINRLKYIVPSFQLVRSMIKINFSVKGSTLIWRNGALVIVKISLVKKTYHGISRPFHSLQSLMKKPSLVCSEIPHFFDKIYESR